MQGSSGIKQIVKLAVSEAFHTKAMKEKENTSIVIYGVKENKNDLNDVKDVFYKMKCNIRVTTLCRLGNLAK